MLANQNKRITMRKAMTWEVANSAWSNRIGPQWTSRIREWSETPLLPFRVGFIVFYVAMMFIAPIDMHPKVVSEAHHASQMAFVQPTFTQFVVWLLHLHFAFTLFGYVLDVVMHVPWKDKKFPLVYFPRIDGMGAIGLHLVLLGGLALYQTLQQSFHAYLLVGEGAVLLYLQFVRPALGFVKWTPADQIKFEQQRETTVAPAASTKSAADTDETYAVPFAARPTNKTFASIFGMTAVKEKLLPPAKLAVVAREMGGEDPRNGILVFGEPGNGKTVFAEALAGELGVPLIEVTYGAMSSQWVGNMPKVLSNTFAYAKRCAPCVLFIDEIDSFIKSRDTAGGSSEDTKITNTLLTEIVNLRGHQVVLVAATNYLAHLDAAAIREGRFDYKIEITPPDEEARIGLIYSGIAKYAKGLDVVDADAVSVAKRWNGFSVARLMAVCKALPDVAKKLGDSRIELSTWMAALREVQGRTGKSLGATKSLSELVLDTDTRDALDLIAARLKDVARIEAMGGTLPTGVLFYGPSGTGKTATARALAKEVGWAFLSVAGPDLLADRTKLEKIYAEAKDIRPTLVFIDEADDVLRNRQYSTTPEVVNKMLSIMDGTDDRVKDVVWIAATNNPDQIDPALVRSGRFTEKVLFSTPPQDQIPRHIASWLKPRGVALDASLDVFQLAELLAGHTIADVEGVMQYALNAAIQRTAAGFKPVIEERDIYQAARVVLTGIG